MSDIRLSTQGDIELVNGDLSLTQGADAIVQHLKQRLKTFLGEWFLDNRVGIPYFQQILIKNPDPLVLDTIFKSVVLNTPGVQELIEFDIDLEVATRIMTLTFRARTIDGEIDFSQVLGSF